MTNRLNMVLKKLKQNNEAGFIGLAPIHPDSMDKTLEIADTLISSGVDILMVHIPNWIPWMEGAVLQKAARNPRQKGIKRDNIFEFTRVLRGKYPDLPIILMTLYDTVFTMGQDYFLEQAVRADVDGFDIPNYPVTYIDDCLDFYKETLSSNRHLILAISYELAMSQEETKEYSLLKEMTKNGRGFVFVMNAPGGKSGEGKTLTQDQLKAAIDRVKAMLEQQNNDCAISVVCGISTPTDVEKVVAAGTDAFMIGSAYIKYLQNGKSLQEISEYIKNIKKASYR